jgi:hypothetical protein
VSECDLKAARVCEAGASPPSQPAKSRRTPPDVTLLPSSALLRRPSLLPCTHHSTTKQTIAALKAAGFDVLEASDLALTADISWWDPVDPDAWWRLSSECECWWGMWRGRGGGSPAVAAACSRPWCVGAHGARCWRGCRTIVLNNNNEHRMQQRNTKPPGDCATFP